MLLVQLETSTVFIIVHLPLLWTEPWDNLINMNLYQMSVSREEPSQSHHHFVKTQREDFRKIF